MLSKWWEMLQFVEWVENIIQVLGIFQNFSKSLQRLTKQVPTFYISLNERPFSSKLSLFNISWTRTLPTNVAAEGYVIKTLKQWRGLTCKMYASLKSLWLQHCSLIMKKTSPTDLPLSVSMTLSSSQSILLPTRTLQTSGDAFWKEKKNKKSCMTIKIANW